MRWERFLAALGMTRLVLGMTQVVLEMTKQLKAEGEGDSDASASFQPESFRGQDGRDPLF